MTTLFEITLPLHDNAGVNTDDAHDAFSAVVLHHAGGYSKGQERQGVWFDPATETTYRDAVVPYSIATDPVSFHRILDAAFDLFPDQLAIFHCVLGTATVSERPRNAIAAE